MTSQELRLVIDLARIGLASQVANALPSKTAEMAFALVGVANYHDELLQREAAQAKAAAEAKTEVIEVAEKKAPLAFPAKG